MQIPKSNSESVRYVAFNQDNSALCVGCNSGFRLFSLNSIEKLDETFYEGNLTNVVIVERLYLSSLVVTVSQNTPRRLSLCHFKKGTEICNYSYPNRVLSVRLNRKRLVVCLVDSLYIHNIKDMKVVHTIKETPDNPKGVCSLCPSDDCGYLSYPGSSTMGEVQVFDAHHLVPVVTIPAHDNPLSAMNFSRNGDKLATASDKGTVIRVFSMPEGNKLFEFRRGVKRCVSIHSLSFSSDSLLLACSSNTETVHIFSLDTSSPKRAVKTAPNTSQLALGGGTPTFDDSGNSKTWMGFFGQAIMDSASYLPSNMGEMFAQGRAAFQARIPCLSEDSAYHNVCALTWINKILRLVVASTSGQLYIFNVDLSDVTGGAECSLVRQHKIDGSTGMGVGGSCKQTGTNANRTSASNSPTQKTNAQRSGSASKQRNDSVNSNNNFDFQIQSNDVVTSEDDPHSFSPHSAGIDIPASMHGQNSSKDALGAALIGTTPLSFPCNPGMGSFPTSLASSPATNHGAPSYAGALGSSPSATELEEGDDPSCPSNTAISLDDNAEFPPMTMHTDD